MIFQPESSGSAQELPANLERMVNWVAYLMLLARSLVSDRRRVRRRKIRSILEVRRNSATFCDDSSLEASLPLPIHQKHLDPASPSVGSIYGLDSVIHNVSRKCTRLRIAARLLSCL